MIVRAATRRSYTVLIITFAVAGVLLALSVHGVRWSDLGDAIGRTRPSLLVLASMVLSGSYFARGLRWRLQIKAETPITPLMGFWTAMSGALTNNLLPLRAGEIAKPLVTSHAVNVSIGYAVAAMFVEHVADIIALVVMTAIVALSHAPMPAWLRYAAWVFAALGLLGALALFLFVRIERTLGRLVNRLPLPATAAHAVAATTTKFVAGLRALRRPTDCLAYAALTAIVWVLDIVTGLVIAAALHLPLSWAQMTLLLVALSLSTTAPSTPANIGVWEFVAVAVLVPFGVARMDALAYIIVFQAVTYGIETMWGLTGLAAIAITARPRWRGGERRDAVPPVYIGADSSCAETQGTQRLCRAALTSLILGALGWLLLPIIGSAIAIVFGHWAHWEIGRSGGALRGRPLASAGLILAYSQFGLIIMLAGMMRLPPLP